MDLRSGSPHGYKYRCAYAVGGVRLTILARRASIHLFMTIKTFADKQTAAVFVRVRVQGLAPEVQALAQRKLAVLNAAGQIDELRVPPGNRLEKLGGDRLGQWGIRVNGQWRICFTWADGHAWGVQIVDYH